MGVTVEKSLVCRVELWKEQVERQRKQMIRLEGPGGVEV